MMDKKLKARWIKALRSGRYKQGHRVLANGGYYCCLGVLRKIEPSVKAEDRGRLISATCNITANQQSVLITMNDTLGYSFKEIAKWVRKHL